MPPNNQTPIPLATILGPGGPLAGRIPNYEFRPQQLDAANAIEEALTQSRHAFIEAGTGVGKSQAYLIPAIRLIASGKRVVVSTHTIGLQTQLIEKDIPLAASLFPGVDVRPALMKGRGNYLCKRDLDSAHDDLLKISDESFRRLLEWVKLTGSGDRAELGFEYPEWGDVAASADSCSSRACRYFEECFYFAMRKKAAESNLIIVNHWLYLMDLVGRQSEEKNILPKYDVVIFDEAQHLENVARETLGFHLSSSDIHRWIDKAKSSKAGLSKTELGAMLDAGESLFKPFHNLDQAEFLLEEVCDFPKMQQAATALSVSLEGNLGALRLAAENNSDQKQKDRLESLVRVGDRLRENLHAIWFGPPFQPRDAGAVQFIRRGEVVRREGKHAGQVVELHYSPVNVGVMLRAILWHAVPSVVLTSATLSDSGGFGFVRSALGIEAAYAESHALKPAVERVIGSPFDFQANAALYAPHHMPPPPSGKDGREVLKHADRIAQEILRVVDLSNGRAFLLFTSRRMLDFVYERIRFAVDFTIHRQGDLPPGRLLDAFRKSGGLLMGLQTFWEGVDVAGEALSCVIIDRIPFAVPETPMNRAQEAMIQARGGSSFNELMLPVAQMRLKQGFGRLIRSKEDRGVVAILDSRLVTKSYGKTFIKYLPPASRVHSIEDVRKFWQLPNGKAA